LPSSDDGDALEKRFNLSRKGFAIARIRYADQHEPGYLIIIKTLLTKGLPMNIYHYKTVNEAFPNQTTADQFFDENQFEAYRELGYQLTKQLAEYVYASATKTAFEGRLSVGELMDWLNQLALKKTG